MTAPGNVCDRIDTAMKILAAKGFSKDGQVQGSARYKFIPIAQILDAVREAHAAAGVKVIFGRPEYDTEQGEKRWTEGRKAPNPATGEEYDVKWYFANGHVDVRIIGATPDDCIETVIAFEASDNSDKLTNKIYTNAERALYRTMYAIDESDGSDPEALNYENVVSRFESKVPPKEPTVEEMRATITKTINESLGSVDRYIQIAKSSSPATWDDSIVRKCYRDLQEATQ